MSACGPGVVPGPHGSFDQVRRSLILEERDVMTNRQHIPHPIVALFTACALALVAGCGASGDDRPAPTITSSVPPTTELTIGGEVSTVPRDPASSTEPLRPGVLTTSGVTYSIGEMVGSMVDITITDSEGGRFGYVYAGMAGIGTAEDFSAQLVDIFELSSTSVFVEATVDFSQIAGPLSMQDLFADSPADYLTWMAARPGVTAGPVTDTVFAGLPAQTMSYDVGVVDEAVPCYPDGRGCLASVTDGNFSYAYVDFEQTSVTLYQLKVAGLTFVIAVSELAGASDLAKTITIAERAVPTSAGDAVPLERTSPLSPEVEYYWSGSSLGTYTIVGSPDVKVGASEPGATWVDLISRDGYPCLSITDGAHANVFETMPDGSIQEGEPLTSDFIAFVADNDRVDVVRPASPTVIGAVDAVAIDVTAKQPLGHELFPLFFGGLTLGTGTVRIVAVLREPDAPPDIVMVELDSPCEAVFDSLRLHLNP